MEITYEREVGHCEPSTYIKNVTIKKVEPAQNSDNLELITFEEIGWNAISQKGLHHVGKQVLFIPPESVLPFELSEAANVTKMLSKGRVRVIKLRGNRSEGLILDYNLVKPYIPYIMKWEDLPSVAMRGEMLSPSELPYDFHKFYKMPNILNELNTFKKGDNVFYSEKIHGTNFRFAHMKNPNTGEYRDYVGSHEIPLKQSDKNLYWQVYERIFKNKIPNDVLFFAEIFGLGIQHLSYERKKPEALIFAATSRGQYISIETLKGICIEYNLPVVNFHELVFNDIEEIRTLADSKSEISTTHEREGIVLVSKDFPEKMAKCIGFNYMVGQKKKKRTERH